MIKPQLIFACPECNKTFTYEMLAPYRLNWWNGRYKERSTVKQTSHGWYCDDCIRPYKQQYNIRYYESSIKMQIKGGDGHKSIK